MHAREDDLGLGVGSAMNGSQLTGNAGGRLACCVIEEVQRGYQLFCVLKRMRLVTSFIGLIRNGSPLRCELVKLSGDFLLKICSFAWGEVIEVKKLNRN